MWLMLMTPGADDLVGHWRLAHDWPARHGIRAHVTMRTPFLPPERWHDDDVGAVLRPFLPLDVTLARLENRPGGLVLLVEPDLRLRELTRATDEAWPELAPHKAQWDTFAYHITVVRTEDAAVRERTRAELEPRLPLTVAGTALHASALLPDGRLLHEPLVP